MSSSTVKPWRLEWTPERVRVFWDWYADHPTHYQGDARTANADAGDRLFDACAEALVKAVRAIKADTEAKRLQDEFFAGSAAPF